MNEKLNFIIQKLEKTRMLLSDVFFKTIARGMTTEEIKLKTDVLLDTSDVFKKKIIPCHKRFFDYIFICPKWWFK